MKKLSLFLFPFLLSNPFLYSQTVTGKVVNSKGEGLGGLTVQLYINPNVYSTQSDTDGTFFFQNITKVEDKTLPDGYFISNNYPNPFNPKTRINIYLPKTSKVKIELFNTIGQRVNEIIEKELPAGNNYIDLELNGLSNGIYLSKINIDNKYTVTKKLVLLYGSRHLSNSVSQINIPLYKSTFDLQIDSLVVSWSATGRKTFTNLPNLVGNTLNLGNLLIEIIMGIPCPGITNITYEGKIYNTVLIEGQCWLKENLNVGTRINGSENQQSGNGIEKYCYNDEEANCNTYGGLYQWSETMQYVTTERTRGICPEGWHIPTYAELQALAAAVNNDGNALKEIGQGTGTNTSGFSALLAGYCSGNGYFDYLNAYFWSSTEHDAAYAYCLYLDCCNGSIYFSGYYKENGFSIRCLKDETVGTAPQTPTLTQPTNGATNIPIPPTLSWIDSSDVKSYALQVSISSSFSSFVYNENVGNTTGTQISSLINYNTTYYWRVNASNSYGTSNWSNYWSFTTIPGSERGIPCPGIPTVTYSGKTYNTVFIGDQCWLKENLDVGTMINGNQDQTNQGIIEKYCYNDDENNCTTYGGLYQWNEAMQYVTTEGVRGICPEGWHIPKYSELQILSSAVGDNGNKLKREDQGTGSGKGTNESGFSAMLASYRDYDGSFYYLGHYAYFWSSTVYVATFAYDLYLISSNSVIYFYDNFEDYGFSVRCLKD